LNLYFIFLFRRK